MEQFGGVERGPFFSPRQPHGRRRASFEGLFVLSSSPDVIAGAGAAHARTGGVRASSMKQCGVACVSFVDFAACEKSTSPFTPAKRGGGTPARTPRTRATQRPHTRAASDRTRNAISRRRRSNNPKSARLNSSLSPIASLASSDARNVMCSRQQTTSLPQMHRLVDRPPLSVCPSRACPAPCHSRFPGPAENRRPQ